MLAVRVDTAYLCKVWGEKKTLVVVAFFFFTEERLVSLHDYRSLWIFIYLVHIKKMESFCKCFPFSVFWVKTFKKVKMYKTVP